MRFVIAALVWLVAGSAHAQGPQRLDIGAWLSGQPAATVLNSSDILFTYQGGVDKQVSVSTLFGNIPVPVNVIGNNTAAITADGAQMTVQNSSTTASSIYSQISPFLYRDVVRAVGVIPAGTTVANTSGFGCYILNQAVSTGTAANGVCNWGLVVSSVDGAATWVSNIACNDVANGASTATTNRQCNGIEFDCTLSTNNAGSGCQGFTPILTGVFGEQKGGNAFQPGVGFPASPANAEANAHWTNSFVSPDGVTMASGLNQGAALLVGSSVRHSVSNANSQTILFNRWLSGTEHQDTLVDSASGTLNWGGAAIASPVYVATGAVFGTGAGQVAYGGTTTTGGTCPTGTVGGQTVVGCVIVNVAGTNRNVPYF